MLNVLKETVRGTELIPLEDMLLEESEVFLVDEITPKSANLLIQKLQKNLKEKNSDNYSAVHKIADLYLRKFFEYSDWLDAHPDVETCELKHIMLTAFCSELGLHIGWLEDAMKFEEIPYDDIIV